MARWDNEYPLKNAENNRRKLVNLDLIKEYSWLDEQWVSSWGAIYEQLKK